MQQLSSINKKSIIIIYFFIYKFTITDVINHPKPINIPTTINNIKPMNIPREKDIPNANEIIAIQKDTKNNTNDNHQNIQDYIDQNLKDIQNDFNNKDDINDVNDNHDVKDHHDVKNKTVLFIIILCLSVGAVSIISLVWLNNPETQQNNQINKRSKILNSNDQKNKAKPQEENNIILKPALEKALQKISQKNNAFNEIMKKLNDTDQLIKTDGTSIKDQIENLSTLRLEELKPKEIQAFDENIKYINADALSRTKLFIPYVHVDHIKYFTENQIKKFNGNILNQFNKEQVQAFDKNIKDIDPEKLIESPQFISFLSTKQIKESLTKETIENLIQKFGNRIFDVFNEEQVQAFDNKIQYIDPSVLSQSSQFVSYLNPNQITKGLNKYQIKNFDSYSLNQFNKEQVEAFVTNIQYINVDALNKRNFFIPYLPADHIKYFLKEQIQKFNRNILDQFNKEQVEAFDTNIKEIPIDELLNTKKFIAYCSEDQINQINQIINQNYSNLFNQQIKEALEKIQEFSDKYTINNIKNLTEIQIKKFDEKILDEFNQVQVQAFSDKIKHIDPNALSKTYQFVSYLDPNQINNFTKEQIKAFNTNILDQFNKEQVKAFGNKIQHININRLKNRSKFIPYLPADHIKHFTEKQIKAFNKNILDQFNKEQVQAFGDKIQYIDAVELSKAFISHIPSNNIQFFKIGQIKEFIYNILDQFNKEQVEALANIQDINTYALSQTTKFIMNLSLAQIENLTDEQIKQISNKITSKLGQEEENCLREKIQLMMTNIDPFTDTDHKLFSYYSFDQIKSFLPKEIENFNKNILDQFNKEQVQAFGDKIKNINPNILIQSDQFISFLSKKQIKEYLTKKQIKKFDENILYQFNKEQVQAFDNKIKDINPNILIQSDQFISFLSKKQINEFLTDMQILGIRNHGDLFANLGKEQQALIEERFKKI